MNCPDCNGESRVIKTIVGVGVRQRYRSCLACGTKWVSEEKNLRLRWGEPVAGNQHATHRQPPPTDPQPAGNPPAETSNAGGVGGGLPSGSVLSLFPDPSSRSGSYGDRDPDPNARNHASRKDEFSVDFLAFWSVYPRKVAKPLAWRSWRRQAPKLDDILAALAWQRETAQWQDPDKIPHPSSYLNGRRWEDERFPNARPGTNGAATGPSPKRSDYCDDHIDGRSKLWSSRPMASCPECRHQRAKYPKHPRVVSMEELFAKETG